MIDTCTMSGIFDLQQQITIQYLYLIDPSGPDLDQYTTEEVWEAAEKLCERRGIDHTNLRQEVEEVRSEFPDYDSTLKGHHLDLGFGIRLRV